MQLIVDRSGVVRAVYTEAIELATLGRLTIARASRVEPDDDGRWNANLGPVDGPVLGPFDRRSDAIEAEVAWIEEHRL